MLVAMSCTLWMIGQFQWTYYEVTYIRIFRTSIPVT